MRIKRLACAVLAASVVLCGCSVGVPQELSYGAARLQGIPAAAGRTEAFAEDLCVVTETDPVQDAEIHAQAAAVFGADSTEILVQKQVFQRMYPASITKVMTALVALKYGNLQDEVTVGPEAVISEAGATLCHIEPGDTLTLEQLLYGLMLPSGNDAGAAIAVHIAGSIEAFSELMNQEAMALGATDSHFVNPHGLHDENHFTTAYDLYLIFKEALQYPEFRTIIGTSSYEAHFTGKDGTEKTKVWSNSNQYLTGERETPSGLTVLGGKTGTTMAAGYCLMIAVEDENGQDYIAIVLKADSRPGLYDSMTNIIQKIVN